MNLGQATNDRKRMVALMEALRERIPASAVERIPALLDALPDPLGALQRLEQFYRQLPWEPKPEDYEGKAIHAALTAFGNSRYLSNMLLNSPGLLRWALAPENLDHTIPTGELRSDLGAIAANARDEDVAQLIVRFKRKHMLRIAMRDLLSVASLAETALELSNLADVSIQAAHDHIRQDLVQRFGRPLCRTETGQIHCYFAVVALGKLGGSELNYSSDIDLMYIHTGDGHTAGPVVTTNKDFTDQLAKRLTGLLSMMTPEGFSYRVDLRLRPEGNAGELVAPVSGATQYYFHRARDWELQMLLKARPVAGDLRLGRTFLDIVTPQIYRTSTDFSQIDRLAETRDRIQRQKRSRQRKSLDVKLDAGGIRDIEFLVQCLQRLHGGQDRFLRSGGTMYALHRLREKGYLDSRDYGSLFNAYRYLRRAEHHLQLVDNRQTHELPRDEAGLRFLATQMGIRSQSDLSEQVKTEIESHLTAVSEIYERVIPSQRTVASKPAVKVPAAAVPAREERGDAPVASSVWRKRLPEIERFSVPLAAELGELSLRWGNRALESFLDRIVSLPNVMTTIGDRLDLVPRIGELMEFSPHFAGYLARFPEDVAVMSAPDGAAAPNGAERSARDSAPMHPTLAAILAGDSKPEEAAGELRRFFRRRMLSIQTGSICDREGVFSTLLGASDLAEWILQAAHALALRESAGNGDLRVDSPDAMRIIALGRLGMREFDLGSDADIVFVIPDSESKRLTLWTQVANRIIDIVISYTADGQMFSIDPRLRPLGRDGELVQTERQFLNYFADQAESWEAITYMKARTVAGDLETGKQFLVQLQQVLWQQFAQREELRALLVRMRSRLEVEQGEAKPLKSGPGGYYDIDFLLLYWRLIRAESFYESLNTPQRIAIIRETDPSHTDDLKVLLKATTVFRALDHGVRLSKGTSSHDLPPTEWQRELLAGLVSRWLPEDVRDLPLAELLVASRESVRTVFNSAFRAAE